MGRTPTLRHLTSRHLLHAGEIRIRPARAADASPVARLIESVVAEDRWFLAAPDEHVADPDRLRRRLERLQAEQNSLALVAIRAGAIVGFVEATGGSLRRTAHESHVVVYVDGVHRNGGVGTTLMAELIRRACERPGMMRLALAVFADNLRAVSLYRSLGFSEEGLRRGACRERDGVLRDEILMALDVSGG